MRLIVQGNARSALRLAGISSRAAGGSYGHFNNRLGFNQGRSYASAPLRTESAQKLKSSWRLITGAGIVGVGMLVASKSQTISLEDSKSREPPSVVTPEAAADPKHELISMKEVEKHNSLETGLWVVIQGQVYDLTEFIESHPGGKEVILKHAGKDVTKIYTPIHPSDAITENLDPSSHLGSIDPSTIQISQTEETSAEKSRRELLENLPHVGTMLNLDDFEKMAEKLLSEQGWAYYRSAGDDEISYEHNRNAFSRIWFRPRVLRKVAKVDAKTRILEDKIESSLPIYISPAALAKLGHPDGELNLTRAAGRCGIVQGISANASVSLDEMLDARIPGQPIIYQLYVNRDRSATERILEKVQKRGCNAILLTVDAPIMGHRERDMRSKGEKVETGGGVGGDTSSGGGVASAISGYIDADLCWDDLKWLRKVCSLPIILKGIGSVADVELADQHGIKGIVLSNHGGRSLDFSPAPIDVLIELREKRPDLIEKMDIYIDGGVRRGTDVLKALALGAKAVGLGRPFLYAQTGFGEAGAVRAIEIMADEIERGMRFLGINSLSELSPDMIDVLPRTYNPQRK